MTDDPIAHASSTVMTWASLAATAAEAFAQVAAMRARDRAERDRARAQTLRAERHARYARDKVYWQPMLDPRRYPQTPIKAAGLAWAAAHGWHGDPEADRAASLAEARLRHLRPDVMRLWDVHRAEGMDPIAAMMRVAPLMDRPPAHPSAPERLELTVPRSAEEAVQDSFPDPAEEVSVTEAYRQRLVDAHRDAERWFRYQLDGSWVPDYLHARGLDGCLAPSSPWAVGYAPGGWTALVEQLRGRGYTDQELLDAGLASSTKRGTVVDRFRDRLMISARNDRGDTVGFVGRAAPDQRDVRTPKYLNSPQTALYQKGEILLGLAEQRAELQGGAAPVLVEGAFDAVAVSLAGAGSYVGVAPSGTAVTAAQMRALHAVTDADVLVVAFDGDAAGRRAAGRAFGLAHGAGFAPKAAVLPDGHDPADLWAGGLGGVLVGRLQTCRPLADLVVDARLAEWPHRLESGQDRVNAAHSAAAVIATLPVTEIARQVGRVAERLDLAVPAVTAAVTDALSSRTPARDQRHVGMRRRGCPAEVGGLAGADRRAGVRVPAGGAGRAGVAGHPGAVSGGPVGSGVHLRAAADGRRRLDHRAGQIGPAVSVPGSDDRGEGCDALVVGAGPARGFAGEREARAGGRGPAGHQHRGHARSDRGSPVRLP